MPQEIYNEGRVVGLSAWELFVRNALENGVNPSDIPNENQWLTSMIGVGSSMILRIAANTSAGVHDYELPIGSNLSAAGVIIASPFLGACEWDASTWATKVTSYSPLILNNSTDHPSDDVPYDSDYSIFYYKNSVSEFSKLTDGIVFTKNANWIPTESGNPYEDIDPNFNESSTVVRLYVSSTIKYDVAVLLTGFTNKRILQGLSGYAHEDSGHSTGGSADVTNNDWQNGGMIGPEIIPWANKIIFTVPTSAYNLSNSIDRAIPSDTTYSDGTRYGFSFTNVDGAIKPNSLIDFNSINLTDYYNVHSSDFLGTPTLSERVNETSMGIGDSYNELVAWYPGMTAAKINSATSASEFFPPALYATKFTASGDQTLVPLDTAAPGTVKGFRSDAQASAYLSVMPDNFAIYHNTTTNLFSFAISGVSPNNWSGTAKIEYLAQPKASISAGTQSVKVVALTNSNGTDYSTSGSASTLSTTTLGKFTWDNMLTALTDNQTVDTLNNRVRGFATELNSNKIGIDTTNNRILEVGTDKVVLNPTVANASTNLTSKLDAGTKFATLPTNDSIKVGTNFIEFTDVTNSNAKIRLYISSKNPGTTNVPVGSIGIGWVNS